MMTRSPALSTNMNSVLMLRGMPSVAARQVVRQFSRPRSAGRVNPKPIAIAANWLITPPQA